MSGIIDSSGVYVIGGLNNYVSGTVSLTSSAPNRAIQLSINGGVTYFVPQYDAEEPEMIGLVIKAPITHIRFIGAEGDEWRSLV